MSKLSHNSAIKEIHEYVGRIFEEKKNIFLDFFGGAG